MLAHDGSSVKSGSLDDVYTRLRHVINTLPAHGIDAVWQGIVVGDIAVDASGSAIEVQHVGCASSAEHISGEGGCVADGQCLASSGIDCYKIDGFVALSID